MTNKKKRFSLTNQIFFALIAGALTGVILNIVSAGQHIGFINNWLISGLFEIVGKMFISAIRMLVVPLVLTSLICGAAGINDIKKLGRVGGKTLIFYLSTTAIAVTIALIVSYIIDPGIGFQTEIQVAEKIETPVLSIAQTIYSIVPVNPFAAFSEGNMLQVIFFALVFGFSMAALGEKVQNVRTLIEQLNEIVMKMIMVVMATAPFGVFALVANVFAKEGFSAFVPLMKYIICVTVALLIQFSVTYGLALKIFARLSLITFIKKFYSTMLVAFSTASSNATLPVTMETAEKEMGVSNKIASFTLPLGATVNMDGTAIMQGCAVVFISQVYGIDLSLTALLTVVLTATIASIGTAGVPSVGLITLSMVLTQAGLPVEGIALIMGIDRILDMMRTAVNISGDTVVTLIVAKSEGELDESVFNQ
ncbi:MAG TPA: dicarboxylate/amino acid:cation symporter [bacterium]|nr:dicarboxylate/amino acid:cation symporter [bacterium]HOG44066.1 dicarboxylate/amino acid:cation symporter [bacterium]HPY13667.1 dicarboxylate/amino acid:cation symporter [bacterium]HQB09035.1 dicarboxylate/amino acid:cation symporter [bacterium]HQM85308.1 dicarboxylate/amino acid:cation symporter [bacterium]